MGFDLYGKNPACEAGQYFRNSVWGWHPLADYVLSTCYDLMSAEEMQYWHTNDGQLVSDVTAHNIAVRLNQLLASGSVARFEAKHEAERKSLPKQTCQWCNGTGFRDDEVGQQAREANPEFTCNGCNGTGEMDDWDSHYPFSEENVQRFSDFCALSGGFTIC